MESGRLLNTLSVRPEGILTKLSLLEKSSRLHGAGNVIAEFNSSVRDDARVCAYRAY